MTPQAKAVAAEMRRLDDRTRARAVDILRRLGRGEMQSGFPCFAAGIKELERLGVPGVGLLVESERREIAP
jgi:hypothetical protein